MSPLPPEAVYLPFESGPYRMAMALVTVPDNAWFEIDTCYPIEMMERLLRSTGIAPWRYADLLRRHGGRLGVQMKRLNAAVGGLEV